MLNLLRGAPARALLLAALVAGPAFAADPNLGKPVSSPAGLLPAQAFYCADANGLSIACPFNPSADPGLTPATVGGTSALALKGSAGAVSSLNGEFGATAGYVILYDAATAPSPTASLTPSLIRWSFPVQASAGFDKAFPAPIAVTAGAQLLASTSLATYSPPANAPVLLSGQVK